jgi:hypothetical protein
MTGPSLSCLQTSGAEYTTHNRGVESSTLGAVMAHTVRNSIIDNRISDNIMIFGTILARS